MQINYPISKFINIDENYKKAKLIKAEFCPKLALLHVIISSVIQDKSFHLKAIYKMISFAYS